MLDILKKLFASSDPAEIPETTENTETPEGKDFFEKLFQMVKEIQAEGKQTPFKVYFLNEEGITGKVKGLFSTVACDRMAWQYPDIAYWKYIFPTLMGREFKCKVLEASQAENERFRIVVDAHEHPFRKVELIDKAEYSGIILHQTETGLLVDIGSHFRWKYGSLTGFMPSTDFYHHETLQPYEPGQAIKVLYVGANDEGLLFTEAEALDLAAEFVGKIVWVQICKNADAALEYLVKGKYKADLPINKLIYPTRKKKVQKLRNQWANGDIINCEVIEFRPKRGLILKWIDDEPEPIDWSSDYMIDYIGREVDVHVHISQDDETQFFVEDIYPATLTTRNRSKQKNTLSEGEVIKCRICSIDVNDECFKIRWLKQSNSEE